MATSRTVTYVLYGLLVVFFISSLALGAVAWSKTTSFALPLPTSLPALTTLLSPLSGLILLFLHFLYRNASNSHANNFAGYPIRYIIDQLLTIGPTIIGTIALAYLFPAQVLDCNLEQQWRTYYQSKNAHAIRSIQDGLRCCGLRSLRDKAWPFEDKNTGKDACEIQFKYDRSCLGPWRQQQQTASWMVFAGAILIWAFKIGFTQVDRRRATSWMNNINSRGQTNYSRILDSEVHEEEEEENGTTEQGNRALPQASADIENAWLNSRSSA